MNEETTSELEIVDNDSVDLEQQKQQEEANYILNIAYWMPGQNREGQFTVEPKIEQLLFKTKKDADVKLNSFKISKLFTKQTLVGTVSFSIISIELVSIKKYVDWKKEHDALTENTTNTEEINENE